MSQIQNEKLLRRSGSAEADEVTMSECFTPNPSRHALGTRLIPDDAHHKRVLNASVKAVDKPVPSHIWYALSMLHNYVAGDDANCFSDINADNARLRAENARLRFELANKNRRGDTPKKQAYKGHLATEQDACRGFGNHCLPTPVKPAAVGEQEHVDTKRRITTSHICYFGEALIDEEHIDMNRESEASNDCDYPERFPRATSNSISTSNSIENGMDSGCDLDEHQFERVEPSRSVCFEMTSCYSTDSPLTRWRRLCTTLLRPLGRLTVTGGYQLHRVWKESLIHLKRDSDHSTYLLASTTAQRMILTEMVRSNTHAMKERKKKADIFCRACRSHASFRIVWVVASSVVLLLDVITLPINACFHLENSLLINSILCVGAAFWSFDVLANCMIGYQNNGILETQFGKILFVYAQTWLPFDMLMVASDWMLVVTATHHWTSGSVFRFLALVKFLRLVRPRNLEAAIFHDLLGMYQGTMLLYISLCRTAFLYAIYFHVMACLWYGIGSTNEHGWTRDCDAKPHIHCYLSAYHVALTQAHGVAIIEYRTITELAIAVVSLFVGFALFAYFLGQVAYGASQLTKGRKMELKLRCNKFASRHKLTTGLTDRLFTYVATSHVGVVQRNREDNELMKLLPVSLQSDILHETRHPILVRVKLFWHLDKINSNMFSKLCSDAVLDRVYMTYEIVFSSGDVGVYFRIMDSGGFVYICVEEMWLDFAKTLVKTDNQSMGTVLSRAPGFANKASVPLANKASGSMMLAQLEDGTATNTIPRGKGISEMVLWTTWSHAGDLVASADGVLLELDLMAFFDVLQCRADVCAVVAIHAHKYVKHMRSFLGEITDMSELSLSGEFLQDELDSTPRHAMFLSHYKKEAGTEATLLQKELQMLIKRDDDGDEGASPIFLDSEDLHDLNELRNHVVNSCSLVLLLTPGVLSRPWCLVEIVTAKKHGVQIVPVEIQKPGSVFAYPDEEFYKQLRAGAFLTSKDGQLLQSEGIATQEIEEALRLTFAQIALPFSPHKSKNVRKAELADIIGRCTFDSTFIS